MSTSQRRTPSTSWIVNVAAALFILKVTVPLGCAFFLGGILMVSAAVSQMPEWLFQALFIIPACAYVVVLAVALRRIYRGFQQKRRSRS